MKQYVINNELSVSPIALGCMRISNLSVGEIKSLINTSLDNGITFFDHADIYGGGTCEELFAKAIEGNNSIREKMIIQSKCGIRKGYYDFSKEYILSSVDGILSRLKMEYLDVLLLHRPDALVQPEEVAEAFDILYESGKVRNFGVSNENPMQIELLKKYVKQDICFNQLQLSITNSTMISQGLNVNVENESAVCRDASVLDYCRLNDICIQAWSPFQYGFFDGCFIDNDKFVELNRKLEEIAVKYGVTKTTIAVAWILRHPAKIQVIAGSTNEGRIREIAKAMDITITREEWYEIFVSAGNRIL